MSELLPIKRSWEEFISQWVMLTEQENDLVWEKVSLLTELAQTYGKSSIEAFSKDVKVATSTLNNYIRVAKAFPPETRILDVPFEIHLQASYADKFKEGQFEGEDRFKMLQTAAEKGLTGTSIRSVLRKERTKEKLQTQHISCDWCPNGGETYEYIFYSPETRADGGRYYFHQVCFNELKLEIEKHGQRFSSEDDSDTDVSQQVSPDVQEAV